MILIIDTSTNKSQVILAQDLDHFTLIRETPERLPLALQEFDINPDIIAVTSDPGSYTGIRVGKALALGFAASKNIPIVEICSLLGFIPPKDGRYLSLIDARGGGAYTLMQERKGSKVTALGKPQKTPLEELPNLLLTCDGIVGPNLERFSLIRGHECYSDPHMLLDLVKRCRTEQFQYSVSF